jgi:hypothetical protein
MQKKHTGPAPSERQLFKLWDAIEAERSRHGERAALALVNKALQAIAPAQTGGKESRQ